MNVIKYNYRLEKISILYDMFQDQFLTTSSDLFSDAQSLTSPQSPKKEKKTKKNKKLSYKAIMANAPKSPFKCKTHNTINLRLKESGKAAPTCKSCGIKCEGERGHLACPESSGCYTICSACKVCPMNHILRHYVSLKQYDTNVLYTENKFKCSNCEKQRQVVPEGVYHCNPCGFSVCMTCIYNLDKLWEDETAHGELAEIKQEKEEEVEVD